MRWALTGRSAVVADGVEAVRRAGLVAFTGPPGIGKSRVLAEVAAELEASSWPIFRVLATESTQTVPLCPFTMLLPTEPPRDPTLLLAAIAGSIESRAAGRDLLLVVDDAHHLDDGSLALLAVVLANSSATIALTVTDDHPRPPGLSALLDNDRALTTEIGPLERAAIDEIVTAEIGAASEQLLDELWRLSGGNPLVAREALADARAVMVPDETDRWTVGDSLVGRRLAELARRRVADLDAECAQVMTAVAIGAPLPVELLMEVADDHVIDRLQATGLIDVTASGFSGRQVARPAHPLYGEALVIGIGVSARRRCYARLVTAQRSCAADVDQLRVALWQRGTGGAPDAEIALAGARASLARHDPTLAIELLDSVAGLVHPPSAALLRGSALVQLGHCRHADEVFAVGLATQFEESVDGHEQLVVGLAAARGFNLAFGLRRPADADAVLSAAADVLDDKVARSRIDAERGVIAAIGGDFGLAVDTARRILETPDADGATRLSAYVNLTLADTMLGRVADVAADARSGMELAVRHAAALPLASDQIRAMDVVATMTRGDLAGALVVGRRAADASTRLTARLWHGTSAVLLAYVGDLDEAAGAAEIADGQPETADVFGLSGLSLGMLGAVDGQRGSSAHLDRLDEERLRHPDPRNSAWLDRGRAWSRAASGDISGAVEVAIDGGAHAIDRAHVTWGALVLHDAVRVCPVGAGDGAGADVARLLTDAADMTVGAHLIVTMAAHARAAAASDADGLLSVAARFAGFGAVLLAVDAAAQAATAAQDGVTRARAAALSIAWQTRCPGARTPATEGRPAGGPSARVVELALDAARGTPSREIAARRYLSRRTVDNHLGNAYRLLDVSGRDELAAVLAPVLAHPATRPPTHPAEPARGAPAGASGSEVV